MWELWGRGGEGEKWAEATSMVARYDKNPHSSQSLKDREPQSRCLSGQVTDSEFQAENHDRKVLSS